MSKLMNIDISIFKLMTLKLKQQIVSININAKCSFSYAMWPYIKWYTHLLVGVGYKNEVFQTSLGTP